MSYQVKTIQDKSQIEQCEKFVINKYYWDSIQEPTAYGFLGYLEGQGFFMRMYCEETNPRAVYTQPGDPVSQDSTMEVFIGFTEEDETLNNNIMYVNFEINSNSAMLAGYGRNRYERDAISEELYALAAPTAVIEKEHWYSEVLIPECLLQQICDFESIKNGKTFYCNFFKVGEDKSIRHFGSFSPLSSNHPDFHVQIDFAEAVIVK